MLVGWRTTERVGRSTIVSVMVLVRVQNCEKLKLVKE